MKNLILIGGGGHCKSCIDVIEQEAKYKIAGILDRVELQGTALLGYPFIGTDHDIEKLAGQNYTFLITIGQIKSPAIREKINLLLQKNNAKIATIISPRAYVSQHARIGNGSIIMHDALINSSVSIGTHCIINTKALVEHDSIVEDFCHISTGAIINGGTRIKNGTFFGSNAVSKEGITTKTNDFIKAGSITKGL